MTLFTTLWHYYLQEVKLNHNYLGKSIWRFGNLLEISREQNCAILLKFNWCFWTKHTKDKTPQDTIQRPNTIYGVTKVAGELLCDYYYKDLALMQEVYDIQELSQMLQLLWRYHRLSVHIYYEALKYEKFSCF